MSPRGAWRPRWRCLGSLGSTGRLWIVRWARRARKGREKLAEEGGGVLALGRTAYGTWKILLASASIGQLGHPSTKIVAELAVGHEMSPVVGQL